MAMSRGWKASVSKALQDYNIRHRCLTSHAFMRHSAAHLAGIAEMPPHLRAQRAACISGVPILFSSARFSQNDYGLLFLWDQPVEMVLRAAATLQMRSNAGATLCVVFVAKAVRDKFSRRNDFITLCRDRRSTAQHEIAYFIDCMLKENIDV